MAKKRQLSDPQVRKTEGEVLMFWPGSNKLWLNPGGVHHCTALHFNHKQTKMQKQNKDPSFTAYKSSCIAMQKLTTWAFWEHKTRRNYVNR